MNHLRSAALGLAVALGLAACGPGGDEQPRPTGAPGLEVVATTTILGDLVGQLVRTDGSVEVLMQPGQDPHSYAPSAQQAQTVRSADLVVANGLGLEESLEDLLEAATEDGANVFAVAPLLDPAGTDDHEEHAGEAEEGDGHDHDGEDPHVWYDPLRMARAAELLAEELARVDGVLDDAEWAARGETLAADLRAAHQEIVELLADVPDSCRVLVTSHDSFGYFAARYDFEIVGTVIPGTSSQAEPSARDLAELAQLLREREVPAIFAETIGPNRLAQTLAGEVGRDVVIETLYTDSLGPSGSGAETYRGMILTNAQRIADALGSC